MPSRSPPSTPSRVQALYDLCKRTFPPPSSSSSSPPPDHAIRAVSSLLDTITPADVGLGDDDVDESNILKDSLSAVTPPFMYLHVYNCDAFSIGIFCLPTSVTIPLHDHPGMTVLTKLLYGSMHVKSYDWVEPAVLASNSHSKPGCFLYSVSICVFFILFIYYQLLIYTNCGHGFISSHGVISFLSLRIYRSVKHLYLHCFQEYQVRACPTTSPNRTLQTRI
uniref:cysteine dioxygenase n=1 Tax=Oryza nivara TaxID=4536 RepID=A0A0E0G5M8_ORYNI